MAEGLLYRRASASDIDRLVELRRAQLLEEGAEETFDIRPALRDYYERHFADDTFISWIACDTEGSIVATGGISIAEKPPYFGCPSGRIALLSSMYTLPALRRKGIATELLRRLADEARERGCGVIQVTASDDGVALYRSFGFSHNANFMQYKL